MRLIDADALMVQYERIDWYSVSKSGGLMRGATSEDNPVIHYYDGEEVIKNAPTIEAEPVRHGRWIEPQRLYYGAKQYECSLCYSDTFWNKHSIYEKYPHCPNCGAIMDLEG